MQIDPSVWLGAFQAFPDLSGEFWAAIIGAIVGSLVGGAISWRLQRSQQKAYSFERDSGLASSLFVKLYKIDADLGGVRNLMMQADERATAMQRNLDFMSLMPVPNLPREVDIDPAELALLLRLKANDLYKRVVGVEVDHRSTIGLLRTYADRRPILTSQLPDPIAIEGSVVSFKMDDESMLRIAPLRQEVDSLVVALHRSAQPNAEQATAILLEVAKAAKEYLPSVGIKARDPAASPKSI
jgi:hypothetical protein